MNEKFIKFFAFFKNNGICFQNTLNQTISCLCQQGFTGQRCETLINNCAGNPCKNGATCTSTASSFTCTCPIGFTGNTCQLTKFICDSNK